MGWKSPELNTRCLKFPFSMVRELRLCGPHVPAELFQKGSFQQSQLLNCPHPLHPYKRAERWRDVIFGGISEKGSTPLGDDLCLKAGELLSQKELPIPSPCKANTRSGKKEGREMLRLV